LTKYLFGQGVTATVLDWSSHYTPEEMLEISNSIDLFISTPYGVAILIDHYRIPPEKCSVVLHAMRDLEQLTWFSPDNFMRLHSYGVVSEWLKEKSIQAGMPRVPQVVPLGINYHAFYHAPSTRLETLSYAGAINPDNIHRHIKRPWLVQQVAEQTGLYLRIAHTYHKTWITMPGFYHTVDAVIIASTEEGAGLPALEASAAGKLVISTPVGLWRDLHGNTGHTVPIEDQQFVQETVALIEFYRDNPDAYLEKCLQAQEHARSYDWSHVVHHWVNLVQ
jgi:glycosyltransferase involved in cell wall biosynthesis